MRIPEGMWMLLTSGRCEYLRRWAGEAGGGAQGAAGGEGLQELPFLQLSPWLLLAFCSWRSSFQEWSLKLEPSFQVDMVSAAKYWQGRAAPRITFHSSWIANLTKSLLDSIQSWLETQNVDSMICSHFHEKCCYFIFHCYDCTVKEYASSTLSLYLP